MIDCSHANSGKDPARQPEVFAELVRQGLSDRTVIGAMVESNLYAGCQKFPQPLEALEYGVSITDGCIDWETTASIIREAHSSLAPLFTS